MELNIIVNNNEQDMTKFGAVTEVREAAIQAAPAHDVSGTYLANENAVKLHPQAQHLVIAEIIPHEAADAKTFVFQRPDGKPVAFFRAGQYMSVSVKIGNTITTRPYSISSAPQWALEGKYAITVKRNNTGFVSEYILENWKVGDEVVVSCGHGSFHYESLRDAKDVIALAGGSGITPFLSMAYAIRDGMEDFNLTILFGSRTEESILFKKELDEICAACPKVKVVHILSDEKKPGYEHGFITADLIRKYAPAQYSVFICGPEGMYRFVAGEVAQLGLPERFVRCEMMGVTKSVHEQPEYPVDAAGKTFNITVKQGPQTYSITGLANEPILTSVERAGILAPSRCRSGECGWCRSKLVSGTVYVPEENDDRRWADRKFGYIHPCSSFPVSDIVMEVPGSYQK